MTLIFVRQSRKRAKDKMWVTSGIKQSSKHKNKLYRKWLQSKCYFDEEKYKKITGNYIRELSMWQKSNTSKNYLTPVRIL